MRAGRRGRWLTIGGGLILTALMVVAGALLIRRGALMSRAVPVAHADGWIHEYSGYCWKSPHELLIFRQANSRAVSLLDTRTGSEEPLAAFNGRDNTLDQNRLSPDGKWLLTNTSRYSGRPGVIITNGGPGVLIKRPLYNTLLRAVGLDGTRGRVWKLDADTERTLGWLPDGKRWLEMRWNDKGMQPVVHRLDGPDIKSPLYYGPSSWLLGVTSDDRAIFATSGNGKVTLLFHSLKPGPVTTTKVSIPFAPDATISEIEPSPSGDRIAYLVQARRIPPFQRFLQRFWPGLSATPRTEYSLWVSRGDGGDLREIGAETSEELCALQWTPDSKRLSFLGNKLLYAVEAE